MSDDNNATNQTATDQTTGTDQTATKSHDDDAQETAKWKELSRKWEKQAKANLDKAKAYDELKAKQDEQEPTLKALQDEINALKSANVAANAEAKRQALLNTVSAATGVPTTLIQGANEEEMTESANNVLTFAKTNKMPADKGGGASTTPMTQEEINKIKDPIARVKARAAYLQANN